MRGGGDLTLLVLAGCLTPAPAPAPDAPLLQALEPTHTQASLAEAGAPALRGDITGACPGVVRIEAGAPNVSRPLAATTSPPGPYVLYVPAGEALRLRWGCDPERDGTVRGEAVGEAPLAALNADLALDLRVVDPTIEERFAFEGGATTAPAPEPGAEGPPPDPSLPPAEAAAPPDAAVGPPLPEGPPPDAGPPPPAGATLPPAR